MTHNIIEKTQKYNWNRISLFNKANTEEKIENLLPKGNRESFDILYSPGRVTF